MQNSHSVMTAAFEGNVREVAIDLQISDKRLYEILSKDDYYQKLWRVITPLGRIAPDRLALIQTDFNARCDRILGGRTEPSTAANVHREVGQAIQAILDNDGPAIRKQEIIEAITELQKELEKCQ